jgi:outer membrane protein assembly factor BamB
VPSIQQPWVAGSTVFVVDTGGQLLALSRKDGKTRWIVKLPGAKTWSGPVLAGGNLWLTSSTGRLVGVDAGTGKIVQNQDLGQPIYIAPVVAGGRMYVLTDKAKLIALN